MELTGILLSRGDNPGPNTVSQHSLLVILAILSLLLDFITFARISHFWTLFFTFAQSIGVFSGVAGRITHLFQNNTARDTKPGRPESVFHAAFAQSVKQAYSQAGISPVEEERQPWAQSGI